MRSPELPAPLDVWRGPAPHDGSPRPVLLFVHGGAWRGGGARAVVQAPLLQTLAARGWLVLSCNYRKGRWPEQLEGVLAAARWAALEAAAWGGDPRRVALAGPSAGGHLAALLALRAAEEGIFPRGVAACVLFYPCIDPADEGGATVRFPLPCPCLRVRAGQSLLHWFFENLILRGDRSLWPTALPLAELRGAAAAGAARRWPRTLVLHGELDSIVPLQHSRWLLTDLASAGPAPGVAGDDALVVVPGPSARHTLEAGRSKAAAAALMGAAGWLDAACAAAPGATEC